MIQGNIFVYIQRCDRFLGRLYKGIVYSQNFAMHFGKGVLLLEIFFR